MKNTLKNILIIISVISFSGCDMLINDGSSIAPLDSKINFKIIESYDNYVTVSNPQIFIELQTEKKYGCSNFGIITSYKIEDKSVLIDIIGINKPGICATAIGPANGRIKLGQLSGIFEIKFRNNNFTDKYNLLISDSLIILDGKETPNTKPLISFLWRYPKNSFAYLCRTTLTDTIIYENFIDTLKSVIKLTEFYFSDFAKFPYPKSSLGHQYETNARYFYYENEDEFGKIKEVMRAFKQKYFPIANGIGLTIINWMNKKIYSSLL